MSNGIESNEAEGIAVGRGRAGSALIAPFVLLVVSLLLAYPLLRAELTGVGVAFSFIGEDRESRNLATGGPLYLVTQETASVLSSGLSSSLSSDLRPESRLHLFTISRAFGSIGSRLRYGLYPKRLNVEEFGSKSYPEGIVPGDYILIYLPAAALASRENVQAAARIETNMKLYYGLVGHFSERFGDGTGAYGALYRVGGADSGVEQNAVIEGEEG